MIGYTLQMFKIRWCKLSMGANFTSMSAVYAILHAIGPS